jgi:hypothetical protein
LIPRIRRLLAAGTLLAGVACSAAPVVPFAEPRELAGAWRGRMTARSGYAIAALTIKEDGSFSGTMYLDGEDKDFSGAITMVRPGHALYRSTQGFGKVVLEEQGGTRALRFQPDGGGVASVFTPAR